MLTELINFSESISEDFKSIGLMPREGLHILLDIDDSGKIVDDLSQVKYGFYSKKMKDSINYFLEKSAQKQVNSWCINTNKCFDLPKKAIQSCSPLVVGFKREHIEGGKKFIQNSKKEQLQIQERFQTYFKKAEELLLEKNEILNLSFMSFEKFFISEQWKKLYHQILIQRKSKYQQLLNLAEELKSQKSNCTNKVKEQQLKEKIKKIEGDIIEYQPIEDSDYIIFYLNFPLIVYKKTHSKYLNDKLFNTSDYNVELEDGLIYGTNNFQNGFNSNMPFLMHQTASFDITGKISSEDARALYELSRVFSRKSLPNPLPLFIFSEELNNKMIALCKNSEERLSYREIIKTLYSTHEYDLQNYYLLYWTNTRKGVKFLDYDYVAKFEYKVGGTTGLKIKNLFNIYSKGNKNSERKYYSAIKTIFELEDRVLKYLIQNKYHRVNYFSEPDKKDYAKHGLTFISYCKYRKSIYDYVYKSKIAAVNGKEFDEMVFNALKDDIKNNNEYGIKEKLNYWYSLYEYFHNSNNQQNKSNETMASNLNNYMDFVKTIIENNKDNPEATDQEFAFAAGQVIRYILNKSKSADNSFRLLEPYLQISNCNRLKEKISEDFARYKHENFSRKFEKIAAFVLAYDTTTNIKKLQPQLISGLFADNQLFTNKNNLND